MDEYDLHNLLFLLQADEKVLRDWYTKIDEEDKKYASSLLTCYSWNLLDDVRDVKKASEYLSKFCT